MKTQSVTPKSRISFLKILFSVLKFIFKALLWLIALLLTPRKDEDSTMSDMLVNQAEEDVIHNSYPSSKKRH